VNDILFTSATRWRITVPKSNPFKTFLAAAILAASSAQAFALSDEAGHADLNALAEKLVVAGNYALWAFAFMGLVIMGLGVSRIAKARSERRKQPTTLQYRYSEGIWRTLVGLGLIVVPVFATFMSPT
jgi:hypothetical protein